MLVTLARGGSYAPCSWTLLPSSRRILRRLEKATGERSWLFQCDMEWPGLALMLGWSGKVRRGQEEVEAAGAWLDKNEHRTFRVADDCLPVE